MVGTCHTTEIRLGQPRHVISRAGLAGMSLGVLSERSPCLDSLLELLDRNFKEDDICSGRVWTT